jgi:hypothetical protein
MGLSGLQKIAAILRDFLRRLRDAFNPRLIDNARFRVLFRRYD